MQEVAGPVMAIAIILTAVFYRRHSSPALRAGCINSSP